MKSGEEPREVRVVESLCKSAQLDVEAATGAMRREEIEKFLERSRKFKDAAEFHFSRGDYDLSAFNLEQSLQLFLKAKLLERGLEFPKTRTLRKLFLVLGEISGKLEDFKRFESERSLEFASLEDAYITARYFFRDFERGEVERLREFVREVEEFVGEVLD